MLPELQRLLMTLSTEMTRQQRRDLPLKAANAVKRESEERLQALARGGFVRFSAARCGPLALPDPDIRFVALTDAGNAYLLTLRRLQEKAAPPIDSIGGAA